MVNTNIDYIGVLKYLENNRGAPYSDPKAVVDAVEKTRLLEVKKKAQAAVKELDNMAKLCKDKYGLDKYDKIFWLDGTNTKIRKYLWAQMKYADRAGDPISISIFVEMRDEKSACYRISLETRNDKIDEETMVRYHSHMDLTLNHAVGLVYVSGSNELGRLEIMTENQHKIRDKVKAGEIKKVQLCKFIEQKVDQTNEYFEKELLNSVKDLLPYYDYVVKKETEALKEMDLANIELQCDTNEDTNTTGFDKNMILYGPPGTGKTYYTAIYAVAICDRKTMKAVKNMKYSKVMERYEELKKKGRIAFTTFHQSYGYEEFIEGIKPVVDDLESKLGYKIEPGVFKSFCETASKKILKSEDGTLDMTAARVWCVLLDGPNVSKLKTRCFAESCIRIGQNNGPDYISDDTEGLTDEMRRILLDFQEEMSVGDIVVTQRNNKSIDGIAVVTGDYEFEEKDEWPRKRQVKWLMKDKEISLTNLNGETLLARKTVYELKRISPDKILNLIDEIGTLKVKDETRPYVFIIDEINRGNISKIFGELITLIEDTKREGMDEQTNAILPYSGETFSVPSNIYILGTMNTADRSIALMDTALRRRFQFVEMMPDADVLRDIGAANVESLDVAHMLEVMNERITCLYDREHTIGHAFFTKLASNSTITMLSSIFQKSVIPLLQEYFYEDYQKIQLILGDNGKSNPKHKFILDEEVKVKSIFKGNTDDVEDLPEKKYTVNPDAFMNIDAYKEIF